jgi:5-methylcytosine-specific restriction endonuclease McrA
MREWTRAKPQEWHKKEKARKRARYYANRETILARLKEEQKNPVFWEKRKQWHKAKKQALVSALGGKCQVCGFDKYLAALAFHHKNPVTKERVHEWLKRDFNVDKVMLVCFNCHQAIHSGELLV